MRYIKNLTLPFLFTIALIVGVNYACNEKEFLDVSEPGVISANDFPAKIEDIDLMLIDLYGRTRWGFFNHQYRYYSVGVDHTADHGFNDENSFNAYYRIVLNADLVDLTYLWEAHYENIVRANAFFAGLEKFRKIATEAQKKKLDEAEGQARFLRAFNYFYLVNFFGETAITSDADKAKKGVVLRTEVPTKVGDANAKRASIGEVWALIISDLKKAETLLADKKTWDADNKPRVTLWAVKAFLGKSYVFTQDWTNARTILKDVIDNSGKKLVSFDMYRSMFNGENEFNDESLFEIKLDEDTKDVWNNQANTSGQYGVFMSPYYVDKFENGKPVSGLNGFGNGYTHDGNVTRYGFNIPAFSVDEQFATTYRQQSKTARENKTFDPRLTVGILQPYVDSINIYGGWKLIAKANSEGNFDLSKQRAWSLRKFMNTGRGIWDGNAGTTIGSNFYFSRLADVFLLYAEASIRSGQAAEGLEYINKVKRRAYNLPVNTPSSIDYKTLTDKTMASAGDHLANDVLKYERWAELFSEGHWWFDVCRWKIGKQEADYYKEVRSGKLEWNDNKYAFPIPQREILANKEAVQNPGY